MLGWDAVARVQWDRLFHCYGLATDAPAILADLTSSRSDVADVVDYLYGEMLHQGTIYPATVPTVRLIAGVLDAPSIAEGEEPALTDLLEWLSDVANSAARAPIGPEPKEPTQEEWAEFYRSLGEDEHEAWQSPLVAVATRAAVLELRGMVPEIVPILVVHLNDPREAVREQALRALARWGALAPWHEANRVAADWAWARLRESESRDERAAVLLALGEQGADLTVALNDPDPAVRACAALFVRTPAGTAILLEALTRPDEIDDEWFDRRPAHFSVRATLPMLAELMDRGVTLEELLPVALAAIRRPNVSADHEWGPILRLAFPDANYQPGQPPPTLPDQFSPAQRAVLAALANNDKLWRPIDGNADRARRKAGVPNARDDLYALLASR